MSVFAARLKDSRQVLRVLRAAWRKRGTHNVTVRGVVDYNDAGEPVGLEKTALCGGVAPEVLNIRRDYLWGASRAVAPLRSAMGPEACDVWHRQHPRLSRWLPVDISFTKGAV